MTNSIRPDLTYSHDFQNRSEPTSSGRTEPYRQGTGTVPTEKTTHAGVGEEREGNKGRAREAVGVSGGPLWLSEASGSSVRPIGLSACRNERERVRDRGGGRRR